MAKIVLSVFIWLSVLSGILLAQDLTWERIATDNQDFRTVLVSDHDQRIVFSGQSGGLLKSDNAGQDWRRVLVIRGQMRNVNDLAVSRKRPSLVYAATDNGLYRSHDSGERWERIFRGKNNYENQCISIAQNSQLILLGTKAGLFISRDNGRSWYKQAVGLGNKGVSNIDLSWGEKKIIYIAAENGVFKSLDNGQTWENIFTSLISEEPEDMPLTQEPESSVIQEKKYYIKADKQDIKLLYLASDKGVYKSLDQGKSWEKLTGYGLLSSDVRMLCLTSQPQILALTPAGVFIFENERWQEISVGLVAGRLNFITLDRLNNIYLAAEKGLYRSKQNTASHYSGSQITQEYLKSEPEIRKVQDAAVRYAELSPEKISQWRKDAAKRAWWPQISIGLDRNSTDLWHWEGGSTTKTDDDILRRGKDTLDWDVSLSWDLGELIWNDAQTAIDVRSKLMVELRDDILDQVNKLYFERIRVRNELDNLAIEDRQKRFQKQLKLEELAASLDALTCGFYSEQLRLLSNQQ